MIAPIQHGRKNADNVVMIIADTKLCVLLRLYHVPPAA